MSRLMNVTEGLMTYINQVGVREHPVQVRCREETAKLPMAMMQIGPDQGAFMALVAKLIGATRYLEVGSFTGYSALSVALALPANGKIVALDVSKEFTDRARVYWNDAGVSSKIDLRLGPGKESLDAMIAAKEAPFDFAFIDADNMLWSGAVANPEINDADTTALRALNAKIHADDRVDMALAAIGDGVMLARKR